MKKYLLLSMFFRELFQREPYTRCPTQSHAGKQFFQLPLEGRFNGKRSENFVFLFRSPCFLREKLLGFLSADTVFWDYFILCFRVSLQCHTYLQISLLSVLIESMVLSFNPLPLTLNS